MSIIIFLKKYLAYSLFLLIYILSGCAASGPIFNQNKTDVKPGKSRVIVYRALHGSFHTSHISINKNTIGLLRRGGYLIHNASPGNYSLEISRSDGSLSYETKATLKKNTTTYFKYNSRGHLISYIASCGGTEDTIVVCRRENYQPTLNLVEEKTALEELSALKLSQE